MAERNPVPGTGGERYVPCEERDGNESIVYFTRDLSAAGLRKAYEQVAGEVRGRVGVKVHTGEQHGPNIIPREWVAELMAADLPGAAIVETNTYYDGDRYTTEKHRETLAVNGWTFAPVDILDEEGVTAFPVAGGKWFDAVHMGSHLADYDSLVVLTHFKGHTQGGFGGSAKNIGIGCADGRVGKAEIHTTPGSDDQWDIKTEEFMERMMESAKAVCDHFGRRITFVNVMRNMSVSCDCEGTAAAPVVTPNVGILASTRRASTSSTPCARRTTTTSSSAWRRATACASSATCASWGWATGATPFSTSTRSARASSRPTPWRTSCRSPGSAARG